MRILFRKIKTATSIALFCTILSGPVIAGNDTSIIKGFSHIPPSDIGAAPDGYYSFERDPVTVSYGYIHSGKPIGIWVEISRNTLVGITDYSGNRKIHYSIDEALSHFGAYCFDSIEYRDPEKLYYCSCLIVSDSMKERGMCLELGGKVLAFKRVMNGIPEGPNLVFCNQKLVLQSTFEFGKIEGLVTEYDTSGKVKSVVRYDHGFLDGEAIFYRKKPVYLIYRQGELIYSSASLKHMEEYGWFTENKFYPTFGVGMIVFLHDGFRGHYGLNKD